MRDLAPALVLVVLMAACSPAQAQGAQAQDASANCAAAEKRYREITGQPSAEARPPVVLLFNYAFCPAEVSVKTGTILRFFNADKRTSHSVWFKAAGRAESERFFGGEHVDVTIDLPPGQHEVLCGPHWEHQNMRAMVSVTP